MPQERKKSSDEWRETRPRPPHASATAAPLEEELEEVEESLPARADVHYDEASTDGEESEEELEMTGRR